MTHQRHIWRAMLRGLLIAATLIALGVGSVSAAPDNKNSYEVTMTCPEVGETFTLVLVDPNSAARHIQGTNNNVILASVVGEATIDGVTFLIDFSPSEKRFEHQQLTTCFVNDTFVLPKTGQSVAVDVTVRAILTPRGH